MSVDGLSSIVTSEEDDRPWAQAWLRDESLEDLNERIHGDDPADALYEGARFLHETAVKLWPSAAPKKRGRVLDVGSGVGWPLQAGMDLFPGCRITGLDISKPMVAQAKARLAKVANAADYKGRYSFKLYDGLSFPFADDSFDLIYSYRVLWHIPEPHLFPILKEMARVLRPGGAAIVHFLPFDGMTPEAMSKECENQRENRDEHYHYYYTYQKIHWWICQILGCTDLEIKQSARLLWVHFGKGGKTKVLNPVFFQSLCDLEYHVMAPPGRVPERDEQIAELRVAVAERDEQISAIYKSTSWRITKPLRGAKTMSRAILRKISRQPAV